MSDVSLVTLRSSAQKASPTVRAFLKDRASEDAFRECFTVLGIEGVQFATGTVDTAIPVLAGERSPQLLIVDVCGIDDPVASLYELAEVCDPDVSVVVIGEHNDVVLYRDMKDAGITEYFLKPLTCDLVIRTCKGILFPENTAPSQRTGKLVFMLGVRGGSGATTIAINTAWHLAEARRRRTLLLDLDLQTGDIPLQLDTKPADALREALEHPERVDKLFLERAIKPITKRLDLLACLRPLQSAAGFTEEAVQLLLNKLLPHYRFVIVDLPHYAAAWTKTMLRLPSTCVVISNASLAAARDTGRWSDILGANTPERSTVYVLNRAAARGGLDAKEFATVSGKEPDFVIPHDNELAEASPHGIQAMRRCSGFQHSLRPILSFLAGEAVEKKASILRRAFGFLSGPTFPPRRK
jgi:pilus assembly protein CpaE